jgi:hypothetical protein
LKNLRKSTITLFLALLLMSVVLPTLLVNSANAEDDENLDVTSEPYGHWNKIQADLITILFPANGKKPMFLWWYTNDTNNIYVVKYKGLIEYLTLDAPYYLRKSEANSLRMRERLDAKFAMPGYYQMGIRNKIFGFMAGQLDLHPPYLPFSACRWNLTGPTNVTRNDGVSYISFNFTLVAAPQRFDFAEGNVVIRCRFYATDVVEDVYGLYNYTVKAGELKMDFVVNGWEWNVDKLDALFNVLHDEFNMTVPNMKAGLALWINLASIKMEDLPIAENDSNTSPQTLKPETSEDDLAEPVEMNSAMSDMIVGGRRIRVRGNILTEADPLAVGTRLHERLKLHFARESQELAGFFDFVSTATVINSTTGDKSMVNVTAAYMAAGNHMRLYLGYPYFGNNALEHDPTIGVETVASWLPRNLLAILIAATIVIAVVVIAVRMRKRTVNIVSVQ